MGVRSAQSDLCRVYHLYRNICIELLCYSSTCIVLRSHLPAMPLPSQKTPTGDTTLQLKPPASGGVHGDTPASLSPREPRLRIATTLHMPPPPAVDIAILHQSKDKHSEEEIRANIAALQATTKRCASDGGSVTAACIYIF